MTETISENRPAPGASPERYGAWDDAVALIGYETEISRAEIPVELGVMQVLAGLVEDGNPEYWDEGYSTALWGHPIAPAAIVQAIFCELRWHPSGSTENRGAGIPLGTIARSLVPLPTNTLINAGVDHTFHRPFRVGEWLRVTETLVSVSEEKQTGLGAGYFVTTLCKYFDDDDELVAEGLNTLFRYTARENEEVGA